MVKEVEMGRKGKGGRRNAKILRAIAQIKEMQRGFRKAIGKMRKKKGNDSEKVGETISLSLLQKGLIKGAKKSERWSYMDLVLKTDLVVWRLRDGALIPIQFKSSFISYEGKEKYRFFEKQYGKLPVFMVIRPQDTDLAKLEDLLLRRVDSWEGSFSCEDWQFEYSKFFDFEHYRDFGTLKRRIMIFFSTKQRKEAQQAQLEKTNNQEVLELNLN